MKVKFLTAREAVNLIFDGAVVGTGGFVGVGVPEELEAILEERYLETNSPKDLTIYYAAGQGDGKDRALNHLAHEGLIKRVIGGHWNLAPKLQALALGNKIEAYNFPQGVISHMFRDAASSKPFTYTRVGLKTFIDPDLEGGKLNEISKEDIVKKEKINGEEFLLYPTPKLDFVILRGTFSDENGNISLQEEAAYGETVAMAMACRNNCGKVIVQVKDIVKKGSLDPRFIKLSEAMVDVVVKTSDVEKYHRQTFGSVYNPKYSGALKAADGDVAAPKMDNRKIIGRIGAKMMKANSVVNLGIGIPELVAAVLNEEGQGDKMTMTVESGIHGGTPAGGTDFGAVVNPDIILDQDRQFDFYDGGGLDITFLGLAQCDEKGNINVSKFGPKIPGCGGFINISQNTKRVVFCGTFTAGGLKQEIKDGKLNIIQEGKMKKFIKKVEQVTFSADYANETGQEVTYVTERAIFELTPDGLLLTHIAPGVRVQEDIIDQMEFRPIVAKELEIIDPIIFNEGLMNLELK